jgi:ABC-type sugar transport system ATPase subunit
VSADRRVATRGPAEDGRAAESSAPLLSIRGLSVRFGGILALDNVSFDVKAGQICGLIGPNGAGKTTLLNRLNRLYEAGAGTIHFAGERLLQLPRHCVASLGIGRTFQNLAVFRTMSVRDNSFSSSLPKPRPRAGAATASVRTCSQAAQISPSKPPKTSPFSPLRKNATGYHSACPGDRNCYGLLTIVCTRLRRSAAA